MRAATALRCRAPRVAPPYVRTFVAKRWCSRPAPAPAPKAIANAASVSKHSAMGTKPIETVAKSFRARAPRAEPVEIGTQNTAKVKSLRPVGAWLLGCAGLTYGMVVLGGVTRLTESGLSITEWKPVTGAMPPSSEEIWQMEFDKYRNSPEFKRLRVADDFGIEEFKRIYFWEWAHRQLGRMIGLAVAVPLVGFTLSGRIPLSSPVFRQSLGILAGVGFQGALGWYMVKSGLEDHRFADDNSVPRVSHYRLAMHLVAALSLYSAMFWIGSGLFFPVFAAGRTAALSASAARRIRGLTMGVTHLTATTIVAGALVAGRDAGLAYNTFPKMAEQWIPDGLMDRVPFWKNFLENDTMIQFQHRYLGLGTLAVAYGAFFASSAKISAALKTAAGQAEKAQLASLRRALATMLVVCNAQVALGIATLVSFVPVSLAAAHQAGSVALLTSAMWVLRVLRRIPK